MRVVVTGGAGYLGIPLCEKLLLRGHDVVVIDEFLHNTPEGVQEHFGALAKKHALRGKIELRRDDLRNIRAQHEVVKGTDAVIHLASLVGDPHCGRFPEDAHQVNFQATRSLIETCEYHNVRKFLFASTCSVYGSHEGVSDETTKANPISFYAKSKIEGERLLEASSLSWTSLRNATIYGLAPRIRFDLVVNIMSARAAAGEPIKVFGGEQWRPNVHVYDCAEAFAMVLDAPKPFTHQQVYNVVHENLTILQIAQEAATAVPAKVEVIKGEVDRRDYRASNKRITGILGWKPKMTVKDAAKEIKVFFDKEKADYNDPKFHNYRQDMDKIYAQILQRGEYDKE